MTISVFAKKSVINPGNNISETGFGHQPKGLFLLGSGNSSDIQQSRLEFAAGVCESDTVENSDYTSASDNLDVTDVGGGNSNFALQAFTPGAPKVIELNVSTIDADGF